MNKLKIMTVIFILTVLLTTFCACAEDNPQVTTSANTTAAQTTTSTAPVTTQDPDSIIPENSIEITDEYVITISDSAEKYVNKISKDFKDDIKEETGVKISIKQDWLKPGESVPELEIVMGVTDREESKTISEALKENEWCVTVKGTKVYISGNTARALSDAVKYFMDNYVKGKTRIFLPKDVYHAETNEFLSIAFSEVEPLKAVPGGGYPRLYELSDGTLLLGVDGRCSRSTDGGETWEPAVDYRRNHVVKGEDKRRYELSCANTAFIQLEDGTVLVAYRATGHIAAGQSVFCTKILVSQSKDGGKTWEAHSEACNYIDEEGQFKGTWEPHFGFLNGVLTCFYANDSRTAVHPTYQNIEYVQWIDGEWTNRTVVADGIKHNSRDGMPVWQQLSTGQYVCAIEGWYPGTAELCIQLFYSDDGVKWSDPVTVYRGKSGYAGAPYVVELATGQLLIVFQCRDNLNGEHFSETITQAILSDGTPVEYLTEANFSAPDNVFNLKDGESGDWNCLYLSSKYLYVASSGVRLKRIALDELYKQLDK